MNGKGQTERGCRLIQHLIRLAEVLEHPEGFLDLIIGRGVHLKTGQHIFELQPLEQGVGFLGVDVAQLRHVPVVIIIAVDVDGGQRLAHDRHVIMLLQRIFRPVGLDLLHMGVGVFDIAVLNDQIRGGLLADARNAGDIVGRITHQGLQLDDLKRGHLIPVNDVLRVIILGLSHTSFRLWQADANMLGGQLQKIPVAGQYRHLHAQGLASFRHGSQEIVRLQTGLFHGRNAHGVQHVFQHRHLLMKLRRHGFSGALIGVVHLMPEGRRLHIEGHRQIIGLFLLQHLK